jgi:hypothetical protein
MDPTRKLYFDMLDSASHKGVERRSGETPLELAPRLNETFATAAPSRITALFDDVRYGGAAPSEDEARRLRREWESRGS